jgi:ribosomal protein S18 acetylase RimI-like enzyme
MASLGRRNDGAAPDSSSGTTSSLFSICVDPAAQGSGLAAAVMAAYLDAERAHGARRVILSVFDDNARAIRFYERSGWTATAREGNSIVYELELAD